MWMTMRKWRMSMTWKLFDHAVRAKTRYVLSVNGTEYFWFQFQRNFRLFMLMSVMCYIVSQPKQISIGRCFCSIEVDWLRRFLRHATIFRHEPAYFYRLQKDPNGIRQFDVCHGIGMHTINFFSRSPLNMCKSCQSSSKRMSTEIKNAFGNLIWSFPANRCRPFY